MTMIGCLLVIFIVLNYVAIIKSVISRKEQEERDLDDDLRTACYVHDVETVRNLLSLDKDVIISGRVQSIIDRRDVNGRTQLMNCGADPQTEDVRKVDYDCYDIAVLLKKAGANLLHVDDRNWDVLSLAVTKGFLKFSKYLIEIGDATIDHKDNDGRTALMKAAGLGLEKIFFMLLSKGANILEKDKNGQTAIHLLVQLAASEDAYIPFLERAIKNIVDEKDKKKSSKLDKIIDNDGRTPLMYAVIANNLQIVKVLIEVGKCDPRYVTDTYGIRATSMSSKVEIQEYLSDVVVKLVELEYREWLRSIENKNEF